MRMQAIRLVLNSLWGEGRADAMADTDRANGFESIVKGIDAFEGWEWRERDLKPVRSIGMELLDCDACGFEARHN